MRIVRRSPLFRIALLSLAVLFAHTARTATRPILPLAPACPAKVAAAQPDPEKKLSPAGKQIVTPGHLPGYLLAGHNLFGHSFAFTNAHAASLLLVQSGSPVALARWTASIAPQRWPFSLRL